MVRDDHEFMPNANTTLEENDLVILAGVKHDVNETLNNAFNLRFNFARRIKKESLN